MMKQQEKKDVYTQVESEIEDKKNVTMCMKKKTLEEKRKALCKCLRLIVVLGFVCSYVL